MKISKSYTLVEFLAWTRRKIYVLLLLALVPVMLYELLGLKWISAPWSVAVLLGTATSFIVGFRNAQTYNRTLEAQQVWSAIAGTSRYWGLIARDFPTTPGNSAVLVRRHLAWLTALRHHLRGRRVWEAVSSPSNAEYRRRFYRVPEHATSLDAELQPYLTPAECAQLAPVKGKATRLLGLQSEAIRALYAKQELVVLHHTEMQKTLKELLDQQGKVERIKNFPYPRQYATINNFFVWCFAALLPFCMVREFDRLNDIGGIFAGQMVWLTVPFSMLISWMYISLDQVGESTENPFEGGANDVPISQICRLVEIELREMLGETDLPPPLTPENQIIL
ncbi:bestrophin family protein [Rhizobacter sp. Root404]|uniref:bestrophin family protein n=1 Tax=Rhizobacter sp. Root404 TaxID=1736528 RepID=UPI0006FBFA3C|nr:bestrophin family ion channel [Rhizobacter sp. Root404]KQW39267.1 multidrug transporter [Rhizobacter sp. Root404]